MPAHLTGQEELQMFSARDNAFQKSCEGKPRLRRASGATPDAGRQR